MRSLWLFLLAFLAYLAGPAPVKHDPRTSTPLASLCSAPFERLVDAVYPGAEPADQARWAGRLTGAFWTAAAVAVTFEALRAVTTSGAAILLALMAGFASPLWSWASRSDTLEAPAAVVVALLLWLAVLPLGPSSRGSSLAVLGSGALAPFLWGLDPWLGFLAPLAILLGVRSRPWTPRAAVFAAAGAGASGLVVWRLVGGGPETSIPLPRLEAFEPGVLAAYLISPGRGLVFFAPIAVLAIAALLRRDEPRRLVRGSALAVALALLSVACLDDPWGPQAFGPALLSPLVPLLAAMAAGLPARGLRWASLVALPLAVAHAAVVLAGGDAWDRRRVPVAHPDAVWDLVDSPFRDLALGPPTPDLAQLLPSAFRMPLGDHGTRAGDEMPWLAFGFDSPEAAGTWAMGRESWIVLAVPPGDYALILTAAAPRVHGHDQELEIERPGGPPVEVEFAGGLWEFQPVTIPFRPEAGISVLKIHSARTWRPGRGDVRSLSLFVASLRLRHAPEKPRSEASPGPATVKP